MSCKALCIGISYQWNDTVPSNMELPQAPNDADKIKSLLEGKYEYTQITFMSDADATRENIINAMWNLVGSATPGDNLVFHFSGHGSQVPCVDGCESDGLDEVIWPVDIQFDPNDQEQNYILDNEIHDILVDRLPAGVRMTIILDCCHSGTATDLPDPPSTPKQRRNFVIKRRTSVYEPAIVAWSACKDPQLTVEFNTGGLLVYYLYDTLANNPRGLTNGNVLTSISDYIQQVYFAVMQQDPVFAQFVNDTAGIPNPGISTSGDYDQAIQAPVEL